MAITPDMMTLIQRKYYFYKRVKQHAIPYSVYHAYCNTLGKVVVKVKVVYLKNKIQAYKNIIHSTLKLANSILGKLKKNSHDLSIHQNHTLITDNLQLANLFSSYFSQIGSKLS